MATAVSRDRRAGLVVFRWTGHGWGFLGTNQVCLLKESLEDEADT